MLTDNFNKRNYNSSATTFTLFEETVEDILNKIDIKDIEKYLRIKKLKNINKDL